MNRTPDDPNNDPTQLAGYGYGEDDSYGEPSYYGAYPESTERPAGWPEPPPPWYLRPVALVGLGVVTALLIALLVWGMVRLVHGNAGQSSPPSTSVTSTTAPSAGQPNEPSPEPVAPGAVPGDSPPPATETESPTPTSEPETTTTTPAPPSTSTTTEPPTTTESPSTTTAPGTTSAPNPTTTTRRPPEIVIPLPGL